MSRFTVPADLAPKAAARPILSTAKATPQILAVFLTPLVALISLSPIEVNAQQESIILEQEASWRVPDSLAPTRLFVGPEGTVLVYAEGSRGFVILDHDLSPIHEGSLPNTLSPVALIPLANAEIEILIRQPPAIARVSTDGELQQLSHIRIPGETLDAAYTPSLGWAALFKSPDGSLTIGFQKQSSDSWVYLPLAEISAPTQSSVYVTATKNAVVLTWADAPHSVYVVSHHTGQSTAFVRRGPIVSDSDSISPNGLPLAPWVSLPTVWLGDAYLQTISDTGSDRRVLVQYDAQGVETTRRHINIPLAFSAGVPDDDGGTVWGARRLNSLEITRYRWRRTRR